MTAPAIVPAPLEAPQAAQGPITIVPRGSLVPIVPPSTLSSKVVRAILGVIAAAAVLGIAYLLRFLVTPVALAILTYYVLSPLVNLMENRRVPRVLAVVLCFLALIGVIAGVGSAVWPSIDAWLQEKPSPGEQSVFEVQLAARLAQWEAWGAATYPQIDWHAVFNNVRGVLDGQRKALMEGLPALLMGVASSAGTFVLAPIIALFLLLDGAAMRKVVVSFVPNSHFETVLTLLHRVDRQISNYLRGAASESTIVAVLLTTVLFVAGMPNAPLFGVLYGLLNVIPLIGPLMGASAGLLYALMDPAAPSLGVLAACYAGVYGLDAGLINPLVVGKNLSLHPLTIILGVTVGGGLGGIVGMLVSIPLIAIGKAIGGTLLDAYRRHRMHRLGAVS